MLLLLKSDIMIPEETEPTTEPEQVSARQKAEDVSEPAPPFITTANPEEVPTEDLLIERGHSINMEFTLDEMGMKEGASITKCHVK